MSNIIFNCLHCDQHLEAPPDMAGDQLECPACKQQIQIPVRGSTSAPQSQRKSTVQTRSNPESQVESTPLRPSNGQFTFQQAKPDGKFGVRHIIGIIGGICISAIIVTLAWSAAAKYKVEKIDQAKTSEGSLSPVPRSGQPEMTKPPIPEIRFGQAVVIDDIRITAYGARLGNIEEKSRADGSITRSAKQYLLIDVTLENVSHGKIIQLFQVWAKTKLIDEFENVERTEFTSDFRSYFIVGCIGFVKMKPGESAKDMLIFDLPVDAAKSFAIESDPKFSGTSVSEDLVHEISDSSFKLIFTKDQIRKE